MLEKRGNMPQTTIYLLIVITAATLLIRTISIASGNSITPFAAVEFTHQHPDDWINSQPRMINDYSGKVLLIDFWTFDCWNCYRSFPWLTAMEERLSPEGLEVLGVHSPEFAHEKVRKNIIAKVREFSLEHPVMIDNDFSYWRAMRNKYWPAFYLIDKQGQVRAIFFGETHAGDAQAERIEETIRKLLSESV
jgi:thiol-disulfide isomerase/thioredoxin